MYSLELTLEYRDNGTASAVLAAVAPENTGYVESSIEGGTLMFKLSSDDASSLRRSADDLLACVKAAEASLGVVYDSRRLR